MAPVTDLRLHDYLDYWARERADGEFAVFGEQRLAWADAAIAANRFAHALINAGLAPGERIAILARNRVEYALVYFAVSKAGLVVVPLNYRSAPAEWAYVVNDARVGLLLVASEFVPAIDAIRSELPEARRFVSLGAAGPDWIDFAGWVAAQPGTPVARHPGDDGDLCQLYTSGTTGHPRGAVLTQRALVSNLVQIGASAHRGRPGERALVAAPMLHAGVVWSGLAPLSWGGSLYIEEGFEAPRAVRVLDSEHIGYAVLAPTMLQACLGVHDASERRYPALRLIHTGSAPVAADTLVRARRTFGCDVVHAYGLTEATAAVTAMQPADYESRSGDDERLLSVGRPLLGTELRVVDDQGRSLPAGDVGEILVRGPQVMRGYWRQPEATAEVLHDGWLRTGDVGRLDADGFLYIQDRLKDVIVSGGVNVYPRMVERVLETHPAVAEVAVVGVPDGHWGESVKAVVVPRAGLNVTEAELIEFARGRLGGFQRPRSVDFVAALPRTTTGKVLKRALREAYWSDRARRVGEV